MIIDKEEWFWTLLDSYDWNQVDSIMKSNRFTWATRKVYRNWYSPSRVIREFIPIIGLCAVASVVIESIARSSQTNPYTKKEV